MRPCGPEPSIRERSRSFSRAKRRTIGEARTWPSVWAPSPEGSPPACGCSSAVPSLFGLLLSFASAFCGATVALGDLLTLALDKGYRLAYRYVFALTCNKLGEGTRVLGLNLHGGLVGLDLGYRVSLGDLVALAHEPLDEGTLLHSVAHLGHYHFRHRSHHLLVKHALCRVCHHIFARERCQLQVPRVGRRDLGPAHPLHRRVQVVERPLLDNRRNLARHPEPPPLLLHRDRPVRLFDRLDDRLLVERPDAAQVYDLDTYIVLFFKLVGHAHAQVDLPTI